MQAQIGDLTASRMHLDADIAHFAAGDLPCQAQAVGKAILDPVGAEFGGQEKVERARILFDATDLDRLDPLAVKLVSQILSQALADVRPIRRQVYRFQIFHEIVLCLFGRPGFRCVAHSRTVPRRAPCGTLELMVSERGTVWPCSGIGASGGLPHFIDFLRARAVPSRADDHCLGRGPDESQGG